MCRPPGRQPAAAEKVRELSRVLPPSFRRASQLGQAEGAFLPALAIELQPGEDLGVQAVADDPGCLVDWFSGEPEKGVDRDVVGQIPKRRNPVTDADHIRPNRFRIRRNLSRLHHLKHG